MFSIWPFYIILAIPSRAASGRFVLLTFNLTCLYAYNLREEETDVWEIAYHRSVAVAIGVVSFSLSSCRVGADDWRC